MSFLQNTLLFATIVLLLKLGIKTKSETLHKLKLGGIKSLQKYIHCIVDVHGTNLEVTEIQFTSMCATMEKFQDGKYMGISISYCTNE